MIDAITLGATLYLPATRKDLIQIVLGRRFPKLRSAVLCLEDSVRSDEVPQGLANTFRLLEQLPTTGSGRPYLFIRPRNPSMLARLLDAPGVERLNGFVIPKATADSLPHYLRQLPHEHHQLMPTLETKEVFDQGAMRRLRDQLLGVQSKILALRIGGNDLLQTIGARRSPVRTCYDGPLGPAIANLIAAFAPYGFSLSAPVFEHYRREDLLREEVERDIEHGLLTKTAIHPSQLTTIEDRYRVDPSEVIEAQAILGGGGPAVFAIEGSMCEPATHGRWAASVMRRAEVFGTSKVQLSAAV